MSSEPNNNPSTPARGTDRSRRAGAGSSSTRNDAIPFWGRSHMKMRFGMAFPDPEVHEERKQKVAKDMKFRNSVFQAPQQYLGPGNYGPRLSDFDVFMRSTILSTKDDILDLQDMCNSKGKNFNEAHDLIMDEPMEKRKHRFEAMMSEIRATMSSLELKRAKPLTKDTLRFQKIVVGMAGFKWGWGSKEDVNLDMVNELLFDWRKKIGEYKIWKDAHRHVRLGQKSPVLPGSPYEKGPNHCFGLVAPLSGPKLA